MKYPDTTAIGDAGEFYFAYQIAHVLRWPCRLFDIDIGLDAQVEILDAKRNSEGRFVAFQVKTTSVENSKTSVYVKRAQVDYWKTLELPVFVVLVDLPTGSMLLHRITDQDYVKTNGGRLRIDFDPSQTFDKSSGRVFAAASQEAALDAIDKYLLPIRQGAQAIEDELKNQIEFPDPNRIIELMEKRHALKDNLARAEALSLSLGTGAQECMNVKQLLDAALIQLGAYMEDWNMDKDYDDLKYGNGEIAKFLDELR